MDPTTGLQGGRCGDRTEIGAAFYGVAPVANRFEISEGFWAKGGTVANEQHEHELTETKKLRRAMAMQAQMVETMAEGMEKEIVDALTKVVFDGKPPARVLYSTVLQAHERRETLRILEQLLESDRLAGRDTAHAKADLATVNARPIPAPIVEPLDVEVFRGEPPEEVSVKALVAAARYWQGLSRAAFEDEVPSDAPLTDRGRLAAKTLAHSSYRMAKLAVIAGVEPHEVAPLFATFAPYWRRVHGRMG